MSSLDLSSKEVLLDLAITEGLVTSALPYSSSPNMQPPPFKLVVNNLTISTRLSKARLSIVGGLSSWTAAGECHEIVRSVNLEVASGEVLALIGGSGSGKSASLPWLLCAVIASAFVS